MNEPRYCAATVGVFTKIALFIQSTVALGEDWTECDILLIWETGLKPSGTFHGSFYNVTRFGARGLFEDTTHKGSPVVAGLSCFIVQGGGACKMASVTSPSYKIS